MADFIHREADYAIRIVAYLSCKKDKVKLKEISEKLFISKPIVVKIVHKLKKCDIIVSETGRYGGIMLGSDLEDLSLFDVLQCMGFNSSINICVQKPDDCSLNPICNITYFFSNIEKEVIERLKSAKIGDFIFEDEDLDGLYQIKKEV